MIQLTPYLVRSCFKKIEKPSPKAKNIKGIADNAKYYHSEEIKEYLTNFKDKTHIPSPIFS
ncbi:MAG: hypothetical protein AB1630_10355 [bacterium]